MRLFFASIIISILGFACNSNNVNSGGNTKVDSKLIKQAITLAEEYTTKQLKNPKTNTSGDGVIVISDEQKAFVIYPSNIHTGLIDDDTKSDAIVSLDCFVGQYQVTGEHLFMISNHGKIRLDTEIESDMKILNIKDGLITAEVHTHARNSPLFNCSSCLEVVRYRYKNQELVKTE